MAVYDNDDDEEYKCEMTDNAGSSSDDKDYELDSEENPERKCLVFETCLKLLLNVCSKWGEPFLNPPKQLVAVCFL